ncbi:hypothetical protein ABZV78_19985 [Micromonospora sp. NPDC004540]|uniref:hypothetical protein n=1 Tax=Micromonospora sp. NPDC004540 TaxID=3154457 RepID=UPI0033A8FF9F
MTGYRMSISKRRAVRALAVAAILLICLPVVLHQLHRAQDVGLRVDSYRTTSDPRVLEAHVEVHPDFAIVRTDVDDNGDRVILHVSARQPTLWWSGGDYAEGRWVRVKADQPLGDRQVLDALTGDSVPRE